MAPALMQKVAEGNITGTQQNQYV